MLCYLNLKIYQTPIANGYEPIHFQTLNMIEVPYIHILSVIMSQLFCTITITNIYFLKI
jgi:hypothetical protein